MRAMAGFCLRKNLNLSLSLITSIWGARLFRPTSGHSAFFGAGSIAREQHAFPLSFGRSQTQTSLIDRFSQNPKSADAELIKYNLKVSNPTGEFPAQRYVALAKAKQLLLEAARSTDFKDLFDDLEEDLEISE